MFRSIIEFKVRPGSEDEFVAAFIEAGMLSRPRAVPGFVSAVLVRAVDGPGDFAVIGEWRSCEAYSAWQSVAQREAPREALQRMAASLASVREGRLFEVIGAGAD